MQHRREIDGLRAVAVIPVILFHAGFQLFGGGFVGVDIFFVISGYLITAILIIDLEQGKFSIARFYERRARRILPALFVVLLVCIPFAWFWMLPSQFADFAQSITAVVFFVSNILFWREEGYFAAASELKPLLHTWSLAVEEQYYLLYPIFLAVIWRLGRGRVLWAVIGIAAASLILSEWGWRNSPNANFYLAPTRAWELLAGAICAFLSVGRPRRSSNIAGAAGLVLIFFAIFGYDSTTPFPSLYALVPVTGTMLIVLFATEDTWVAQLLSADPIVHLGLISYSAYLWHQPLLAFARLRSLTPLGMTLLLSLALLALVLAHFTWRYAERPFRKRPLPLLRSGRSLFLVSAVTGCCLAVIGYALQQAPPLIQIRHPELFTPYEVAEANWRECKDFETIRVGSARCRLYGNGPRLAVIWGDSHAEALAHAVQPIDGFTVMVLSHTGCPPAVGVRRIDRIGNSENCQSTEILGGYQRYISSLKPEFVVLVARWTLYQHGWHKQGLMQSASHLVSNDLVAERNVDASVSSRSLADGTERALQAFDGSTEVLVVSQPADLNFLSDNVIARLEAIDTEQISQWHAPERQLLSRLINARQHVRLVDTRALFCTGRQCALRRDGISLYLDDNHLSAYGATFQWQAIKAALTTVRTHTVAQEDQHHW